MLHQTRGIVFHTVDFSETSIIVKIYTELFGIQSYLVRGSRKKGASLRPVFFQPLSLLDLTAYHREKQNLQTVREARFAHPFQSVPFDIRKSSIALFLCELFYKTIREEEPNPGLFSFLWQSLLQLDEMETVGYFHLVLTLHLTRFLGFFPHADHPSETDYFNLEEGVFQSFPPEHSHFLDEELTPVFRQLLMLEAGTVEPIRISPLIRNRLLDKLLEYYRLHLPGFTELKSVRVLHEVLS